MEQYVIFDPKTKTIYQTYHDDGPDPYSREIVKPNWTNWDPFRAFKTTLEDVVTNENNVSFYLGCSIQSAAYEFKEVLGGIGNYNAKHPEKIFDAESVTISTMDELKREYQEELKKSEYLLEENENKARKIYLKQTNNYSADQAFRDGIKWARKHPEVKE